LDRRPRASRTIPFRRIKRHFKITAPDIVVRPDQSASFYNDALLERLGSDVRHLFLMPPDAQVLVADENGIMTNEWGLRKKLVNGLVLDIGSPLAEADDVSAIREYPWPDPADPGRVRGLKERAEYLTRREYAIACRACPTVFSSCGWELRGMENFFVDLYTDENFRAIFPLDKTLEIQMGPLHRPPAGHGRLCPCRADR
jgi:uroporphyrinogen decarboxylase